MSDLRKLDGVYNTVTIVRSWPAMTASGDVALVAVTKEAGTIAFRLDLKAIELMKRQLAVAEAALQRQPGSA